MCNMSPLLIKLLLEHAETDMNKENIERNIQDLLYYDYYVELLLVHFLAKLLLIDNHCPPVSYFHKKKPMSIWERSIRLELTFD